MIDLLKQCAEAYKQLSAYRYVFTLGRKNRAYPATYQLMILEGSLKQHLMDINEQAHEMLEQLIESMKQSESVTESLKSQNQLEWVQRMNGIKHRAEEIIKAELVYI